MRSYSFEGEDEASKTLWEQYAPQDQEGVNAVFIDGCEFYRDSFPSHVQEHWTPGGNFWVVTTPENSVHKVVGIVGLEDKGDGVGELRRMAVSSAFRRHGLGRRLVNELETWAKDHGFTKIFLMNGGPKEDARAFYRAIGYQDVGMKVVSVEPHVEVFQLAKQLTPDLSISTAATSAMRSAVREPVLQTVAPPPTLHEAIDFNQAQPQAHAVPISGQIASTQTWRDNSVQSHGVSEKDAAAQDYRDSDNEYDLFGASKS
ncbi:hypothetical protein AM588_10003327 [Phytophthora nicotianae]|uniref:N-acetyltransferase domain-containing protein n=1 Tax=Phytophthora nicotianae TaxID=4792 RepID=A0A0W8D209_PHYNI|nr:hypothetical protein AM588_10003327 [Phytophthora nicotianae]